MTHTNAEKFNQHNTKLAHHLTQLLLSLGFQVGNIGFSYLKRVIMLMYNYNCTLKEIYVIISGECKKPPESVSSSVRNSIRTAYRQTNFKILDSLLGVEMFTSNYTVPAPRELVGLINEYLRTFWNGESSLKTA